MPGAPTRVRGARGRGVRGGAPRPAPRYRDQGARGRVGPRGGGRPAPGPTRARRDRGRGGAAAYPGRGAGRKAGPAREQGSTGHVGAALHGCGTRGRSRAHSHRQRAQRRLPVPSGAPGAGRRAADSPHRFRRSVSPSAARGPRVRDPRGGLRPSELGDGSEDLGRLGYHDEQGARGHRGVLAVRDGPGPCRGRRPPPEHRAFDGGIRGRVDSRPARHAGYAYPHRPRACLARAHRLRGARPRFLAAPEARFRAAGLRLGAVPSPRLRGRPRRGHRACGAQRGQRSGGGGVPGPPHDVRRHPRIVEETLSRSVPRDADTLDAILDEDGAAREIAAALVG